MSDNKTPDLSDLWSAIRHHPDFRGGVIWSREDIEMVAKEYEVDPDELDDAVGFDSWADLSISDGFDFTLNPAAADLAATND